MKQFRVYPIESTKFTILRLSLSHDHVLQTASLQITPEEANLPRPYRSTLSGFIQPYRDKIP